MKLYTYWRSTTSYRLRIALNLKGIDYESAPVNLVAGAQREAGYAAVNPGLGVPALELEDGRVLTQSMAILDWLEEVQPEPALLPRDPVDRAHVRAAAFGIATDIHPVNNLRVIGRLKAMGHGPDETTAWMNHWMSEGFTAFQSLIRPDTPFCFGETPGLADLCLVPQLYNAHRWGTDLDPFARLTEIEARCLALPAFQAARPEAQPDAQPGATT
ncbi:maleylacetoacetate isomerase [Maritimibacter sp. DP1N21-5]|uniref:maleylacetoacetate isomerase n=1 Tax=Maritimibacter sp. DP1N21-5 TaxID=2836867 RepID=UPI001C478ABD|nr:maleylacetoacetate isomerase [Maritimibacter sp. DP1N21-5]MBV7410871.1 maleylacetoacetate isomerase [Maritimibacter sp. DP1N21-5]